VNVYSAQLQSSESVPVSSLRQAQHALRRCISRRLQLQGPVHGTTSALALLRWRSSCAESLLKSSELRRFVWTPLAFTAVPVKLLSLRTNEVRRQHLSTRPITIVQHAPHLIPYGARVPLVE
jgi:hypothetical protein